MTTASKTYCYYSCIFGDEHAGFLMSFDWDFGWQDEREECGVIRVVGEDRNVSGNWEGGCRENT